MTDTLSQQEAAALAHKVFSFSDLGESATQAPRGQYLVLKEDAVLNGDTFIPANTELYFETPN